MIYVLWKQCFLGIHASCDWLERYGDSVHLKGTPKGAVIG